MRLLPTALTLLLLAVAAPATPQANPYLPAYTVNGSVITEYDIEQRVLFLDALGAPGDLRELAVEQLIEDRLKLQAAEQLGIELPEDGVALGLEEFATSRNLEVDDVLQVLEARGIDRQTLDDFIVSGLLWREVVNARFRQQSLPSEEDLDAAMAMAATTPVEVLQLAEIAIPFAERGEAETLELADQISAELARGADFGAMARRYSRSASAERNGLLDPVPADQLPAAFRTQLLLLSPGQVTRPVPIAGGVAILKLVSIRQQPPQAASGDAAEQREALRQRLFTERITTFGQGLLQELQVDALIVER